MPGHATPPDLFAHKAPDYDQDARRVDNVARIAEAMLARLRLDRGMRLVDFGSGTGLLLAHIAPLVGHITAIDVSPAMNRQLAAKRATLGCALEILQLDLANTPLERTFDGIISSMTMHHVADTAAMLGRLHGMLVAGGFIALADLEREDGSFHGDKAGVHHQGFEPEALAAQARLAGFDEVHTSTVSEIRKNGRSYPVFLLTACRR